MANIQLPKISIPGIGKINSEAPKNPQDTQESSLAVPKLKPLFALNPVDTKARTAMESPTFAQDTRKALSNGLKTVFGTVKAIGGAIGTPEGRKVIKDSFVDATPGAVAAGERGLAFLSRKVEETVNSYVNARIKPIRDLASFATGGRARIPEIKIPSLNDEFADVLDRDADRNQELSKLLAEQGVEIADERTFSEKIQDPMFIARGIGSNAPNLMISLGLAAPAAVVGAPVAAVGGTAFLTSAVLEGGYAYNEAKDFLETSEREDLRALADDREFLESVAVPVGVVNGLLDALPITRFLSKNPITTEIRQKVLREATKRIVGQAVQEGGTESIQEIVSNSVAKVYDENRGILDNVAEAGFFGGLMGGGLQAAGDVKEVARAVNPEGSVGLSIKDVSGDRENKPEESRAGEPAKIVLGEGRVENVQPGYVYRGLSEAEIESIKNTGSITPSARNTKMGDVDTDNFLYVDPLESEAAEYAKINKGVVIRFPADGRTFELDREDSFSQSILDGKDSVPQNVSELPSLRTRDSIPASEVEVLRDGKWQPLVAAVQETEKTETPPATRESARLFELDREIRKLASKKQAENLAALMGIDIKGVKSLDSIREAAPDARAYFEQLLTLGDSRNVEKAMSSMGYDGIRPRTPEVETNEYGIRPVEARNQEELVNYRLESADPSLPATVAEFDALSPEEQERVYAELPTHLRNEILGIDEEHTITDSYGGAIRDVVYGRQKIRTNRDSSRDYRLSFRPGDYMRIFRKDPLLSPVDEMAMNGDGDTNNFIDELIAGLEKKREIDKETLAFRRNARAQKLEQAKKEKEKEAFLKDIERSLYEEITKKRFSITEKIEAEKRAAAGAAERMERKYSKISAMLQRLDKRRDKMRAIQKFFNLTDAEMRKAKGNKDPRWMTDEEFDTYLANVRSLAEDIQKRSDAQDQVLATIERMDFRKIENLIAAMEMPLAYKKEPKPGQKKAAPEDRPQVRSIADMTTEQLEQFDELMQDYRPYDTFLGPRMIQTIQNTDIGPVKTVRELRESLSKQVGSEMHELSDVRGDWGDRFNYDPALAEKNPLYKFMVLEWNAYKIQADQRAMSFKQELDRFANAARASRSRSIADRLVPQDDLVIKWLEPFEMKSVDGPDGKPKQIVIRRPELREAAQKQMTPEELDFAKFLEKTFLHYYQQTVGEEATRRTLLGIKLSRFKDIYFPHRPNSFFENWRNLANEKLPIEGTFKTKERGAIAGFIGALGRAWKQFTDQNIDFDAIGPTGEVLGYEKFLKYALQREGEGKEEGKPLYSQNAARVALSYVEAFERKLALDAIIPKIDAYTFALQREEGVGQEDPTGLNIDGQLKTFVKEWLNNKKGRRVKLMVSQGSKFEAGLRAFKFFLAIKDLGFNLIAGTASVAGGQISNYVGLKSSEYAKGIGRALTPHGRKVARTYNGVVGEPTFENLISSANDIGDTFVAGAFAIFQNMFYRAKRQFFLGSLTDEEYQSGVVSDRRLAEIKLKMARFHPLDDTKSVIGATPEAQVFTMYKTWAVPFLFTARINAQKTIRAFRRAEGLEGKAKTLATEEARQLMKLTIGSLGIYLFFHTIFGEDDPKDKSFIASLKRRIVMETTSALSALNPSTWLSIRPYQFAVDVAELIDQLISLEEYQTNDPKGKYQKGDLKAIRTFQRIFLPASIRQFKEPVKSPPKNAAGSGSVSGGSVTIPSVKIPSIEIPGLQLNI